MVTVVIDVSMSIDGYVAGPDVSVDTPMGRGGERLHTWLFAGDSGVDAQVEREMRETTGAVVLGRRTFDVGVEVWEDTPYPVPCFVLTHEPLEERVEKSGTFAFVTDVESAFERATEAAGEKVTRLMGAEVSQQFLEAGLVDEVRIQLVPVVLAEGRRLFDGGSGRIELVRTAIIESPHVTHLRYRVAR